MTGYRLRQVDSLSRVEHHYLEPDDVVFYLREYTSGSGYSYGETNSRISNLKKGMNLKGTAQWPYKTRAISDCALELRASIGNPNDYTWVPVPPSKAKGDPLYDDRLLQVLQQAFPDADVREFITQRTSTVASHTTTSRPPPHVLQAGYQLDASLGAPKGSVVVFDDILTTGSHFKAMQTSLLAAFRADVFGLFLARRVFPDDFPDDG